MLGFGYGYNKILPKLDSFRPTFLAGTQLYYAKNTATPSLWNDQSPNGFDLTQAVAAQQPTISANSVDFDGVNDELALSISNPFLSDNLGTFMFSGFYDSASPNRIFSSGDVASANNWIAFSIISGKANLFWNNLGVINNIQLDTTTILNGQYYWVEITSDGVSFTGKTNGIAQTITGTNNGTWFNDISGRDNITIGSLVRNTSLFGLAKVNKIWYGNGSYTLLEKAKLNTFFSDPNNY